MEHAQQRMGVPLGVLHGPCSIGTQRRRCIPHAGAQRRRFRSRAGRHVLAAVMQDMVVRAVAVSASPSWPSRRRRRGRLGVAVVAVSASPSWPTRRRRRGRLGVAVVAVLASPASDARHGPPYLAGSEVKRVQN
jgi:hypothetical protein